MCSFTGQAVLGLYSQEHSLHSHLSCFDQPGSEAETSSVNKEDHGLAEGVGQAVNDGLFPGVPAQKPKQRRNLFKLQVNTVDLRFILTIMSFVILVRDAEIFLI